MDKNGWLKFVGRNKQWLVTKVRKSCKIIIRISTVVPKAMRRSLYQAVTAIFFSLLCSKCTASKNIFVYSKKKMRFCLSIAFCECCSSTLAIVLAVSSHSSSWTFSRPKQLKYSLMIFQADSFVWLAASSWWSLLRVGGRRLIS